MAWDGLFPINVPCRSEIPFAFRSWKWSRNSNGGYSSLNPQFLIGNFIHDIQTAVQLLSLFCQLAFETGIFSSKFIFAVRRWELLLLFIAPVIELWFLQAKVTGQYVQPVSGFLAEFRWVLFANLFGGWWWFCHVSLLWLRVYSLSRVPTSTIAG